MLPLHQDVQINGAADAYRAKLADAILRSLPASVAVLNCAGEIIAVNESWDNFARQGGVIPSANAYVGVNYLDVLRRSTGPDSDEAPAVLEGIEAVLAGRVERFTLEYPCEVPGEGQRWFLVQIVPLRQPESGAVVMHLDITSRRVVEQRKDDFIAIASHELKTPITGLQLSAQLLARRMRTQDRPNDAQAADRIVRQIAHMNRLVEELLDVSRINAGKLTITVQAFDLADLVRETAEVLQLTTSIHRLVVAAPAQSPVNGDPDRLGQVVANLITNAIKFSGASDISVRLEHRQDGVHLLVQDHGSGMDLIDQEHIFDRFYQVRGLEQGRTTGLGMGLYIAREIVELHNGRISVTSRVGEGSTFDVFLPGRPSEDMPADTRAERPGQTVTTNIEG